MGLPAFLHPTAASSPGDALPPLPQPIAERCSAHWNAARAAWATRPAEGSAVEMQALMATCALFFAVMPALASHPQAALRAVVNEALKRVVHEQRAAAEDDRAFALRQLEQAIEHYGVVAETFAESTDVDALLTEAANMSMPEEEMPPQVRPLYRANGALLMAFEAMGSGPADDFRHWARRAVEQWRTVLATLPEVTRVIRAARVHHDARSAWESWTDEDWRAERDSWKALR